MTTQLQQKKGLKKHRQKLEKNQTFFFGVSILDQSLMTD